MTEALTIHHRATFTLFHADDDSADLLRFNHAVQEVYPEARVFSVQNGDDLLVLLTNLQPDLLFLDLDMPGRNGFQCLVEIRKNLHYLELPIVIYSGTGRAANIDTSYQMGADLYFSKPESAEELKTSLKEILELDWSEPARIKARFLVNGSYTRFRKDRSRHNSI